MPYKKSYLIITFLKLILISTRFSKNDIPLINVYFKLFGGLWFVSYLVSYI